MLMAHLTVNGAMKEVLPAGALDLPATSIAELMAELERRHPAVHRLLRDERGALRTTFRVFVNGEDMRGLDGVETRLAPHDQVDIVPSIQGG